MELLDLDEPPTAIFVVNDYCSLGVLHGLAESGVKVPGKMSVVGYDDIWPARLASIELTTVSSEMEAMGRAGLQMLLGLIERGDRHAEPRVLAPQLRVRATTGQPPRRDFVDCRE